MLKPRWQVVATLLWRKEPKAADTPAPLQRWRLSPKLLMPLATRFQWLPLVDFLMDVD